jgi:hypothetical protein
MRPDAIQRALRELSEYLLLSHTLFRNVAKIAGFLQIRSFQNQPLFPN